MLDKRKLSRINDRPRGRGSAVYTALATLVVAAAVAFLISYAAAGMVFLGGTVGVFLLHKRDVEARTTRLIYDLDGEAAARFASVQKACKALSDANKVWRIEGEARGGYSPGEEVLSFDAGISRSPVEVSLLEMPGISANVDIWGIKTDAVSLFFLPEGGLWYKDDRYRAISYGSLNVAYRPVRSIEEGDVPEDAEIVGETWQHVKPDGSPDIRYPNNPRYAIALYGLLSVTGTEPNLRLLVSNKGTAARFAQAFGANQRRASKRSRSRGYSPGREGPPPGRGRGRANSPAARGSGSRIRRIADGDRRGLQEEGQDVPPGHSSKHGARGPRSGRAQDEGDQRRLCRTQAQSSRRIDVRRVRKSRG
jgi:hypothetical protein